MTDNKISPTLILNIIGSVIGIASLVITFSTFRHSVFRLKIITKPNLTFLWCTHPCCESEGSHVVLKWMRIINQSDRPITIFEFNFAGMRAFFNTFTNHSLPDNLSCYEESTYKLPITLPPYGAVEGYFVFRGMGSLPTEKKYTLSAYTSRGVKKLPSMLNYSEADL